MCVLEDREKGRGGGGLHCHVPVEQQWSDSSALCWTLKGLQHVFDNCSGNIMSTSAPSTLLDTWEAVKPYEA